MTLSILSQNGYLGMRSLKVERPKGDGLAVGAPRGVSETIMLESSTVCVDSAEVARHKRSKKAQKSCSSSSQSSLAVPQQTRTHSYHPSLCYGSQDCC